jgi:hypothetical protein
MKRFLPLLVMGCLLTTAFAQKKSARDYYAEARKAAALPELPYVCFREEINVALPIPPTFEMMGSSRQIADVIKKKKYAGMNDADREELEKLHASDYLYIAVYDHGVMGMSHIFDRQDPDDPSRADWVYTGMVHDKKMTWDFNINWGTLRFRERFTMESDRPLIFYGRCELTDK